MKRNNTWIILFSSIIGILILTVPVLMYLYNIGYTASKDSSKWAEFGDYYGGVVNTIISICSLAVLVYITFYVTSRQGQSLFIFQKRIDAYEQLSKYIFEFNLTPQKLSKSTFLLTQKLKSISKKIDTLNIDFNEYFETEFKELQNHALFYDEYSIFIFTFKVRYSHLFKYDFDSDLFKELLNQSKEISIEMNKHSKGFFQFGNHDLSHIEKAQQLTNEHKEYLADFINAIRKEIELN